MSHVDLLDQRIASAFYGTFPELRPLQEAAIEPIMKGQHVVLSAGTGSGKTEAVMAPLISCHWRVALDSECLAILYVAPTKALVNDLEKRLYLPLQSAGLRQGVRHGDRDDLVSGRTPHVLLTTPESLNVLLFRREPALATVRAVVLDEVHLLYNSQRGLQLSVLLQQLRRRTATRFQWAALSATIGRLADVRDFLFGPEEQAVFLQFPSYRPIDAQIRGIESEASLRGLIRRMNAGHRTKLLLFANARRECERLASRLQGERGDLPVFTHYSSLSTEVRVETVQAFAAAPSAICLATSTLELGIDIGDVDAILLWGVPAGVESFLQRIGRGNRRAHKSNVVCLVPDNSKHPVCDALRFLALLDAAQKGELPICEPHELFGAVAQQCLGMIASDGGRYTRVADLCKFFAHRSYLDRNHVESVLAELAHKEYLQRHGFKNQYGAGENLYSLLDYRLIYGNFPVASQVVDVRFRSKVLGSVPAMNLLRVHAGSVVRFAGKSWHVITASPDGIIVEPARRQTGGVDFVYARRGVGFDAFLAQRMWQIIHHEGSSLSVITSPLRDHLAGAREKLRALSSESQIPSFRTAEGIQYLTFGGYLVNRAIALITGQPVFNVDDLSLLATVPIDWQSVPDDPQAFSAVFPLLSEVGLEQSIYQMLLPADLQQREFLQAWSKDTTVNRVLERLTNSKPQPIPSYLCHTIAPPLQI